jgi:hypothetical protein
MFGDHVGRSGRHAGSGSSAADCSGPSAADCGGPEVSERFVVRRRVKPTLGMSAARVVDLDDGWSSGVFNVMVLQPA